MSRKKKTRRLKDKLTVKTGSRKNFLKPGQKGRIPSKNRLAKHQRQKSAYEKHLEQQSEEPSAGEEEPSAGEEQPSAGEEQPSAENAKTDPPASHKGEAAVDEHRR